MERGFADAANCHGAQRARWRGPWKQAITLAHCHRAELEKTTQTSFPD